MTEVTFELQAADPSTSARAGLLHTAHGTVRTPALCPVATQATVKGLDPAELRQLGCEVLLANVYHLYMRPGPEVVSGLGGLHRFMAWGGPIITDGSGWQVFSEGFGLEYAAGKAADRSTAEEEIRPRPRGQPPRIIRTDDDGVTFTSHVDGSRHRFTPEVAVAVQEQLGADVILAFDGGGSHWSGAREADRSLERAHRWAVRSLDARTRGDQAMLGIVQGGSLEEQRRTSASFMSALPFDGFAIGGVLGASRAEVRRVLDWTVPPLPPDRVRHLLGVEGPAGILDAVAGGIDTFDSVAPTRLARREVLYTPEGPLSIGDGRFKEDLSPIVPACTCITCNGFSRAYLHHLFAARELLAYRLAGIHNLHFLLDLVARIREAILQGGFGELRRSFRERWHTAHMGEIG